MNDGESLPINDITIDINDNEEPIRSGRSGNNSGRSGLPAVAKHFALWNLLFELVVGVLFLCFMAALHDDGSAIFICGLIFACVHTAISVDLFKRYYQKNGVPAWKFALLNFLPLFIIGVVMILVPVISELTGFSIGIEFDLMSGVYGVCFAGYSIVYGVFLTAALGIGRLIEKCGWRT